MTELKPYPEYKDSGVEWLGAVPKNWTIEPLGSRFTLRNETVSDSDFEPLSVTKDGVVPQLENVAKSSDGESRKLVRRGDFAINSRSDRKGSSGVSDFDGSVSVITTVVTPRQIDPRFAHHLLRSEPFQEEYYRYGTGIVADLWSTRWPAMKTIRLPIPSSEEQFVIAEFLDRETAEIDAFIADQEQLIELLTERRAATISHAVTKGLDPTVPMKDSGIEWLGSVPASWAITRISRYFSVVLGKMLDAGKSPRSGSIVLPYVRAANIQESGLDLSSVNEMPFSPAELLSLDIRKGDLLVVEGGAVGVNVRIDSDMTGWSFQKTVNRVRSTTKDASTEFLGFALDALRWNGVIDMLSNKSTIAHLTSEKLERIVLAFPPVANQVAIATHLAQVTKDINSTIADAREAIALSRERRAALISAAVTGKIDVRTSARVS